MSRSRRNPRVVTPRSSTFPIVVAIDDSPAGPGVIRATLQFPWPARASVHGVVGTGVPWMAESPKDVLVALTRGLREAAATAERQLRQRWPESTVDVVERAPVPAILSVTRTLAPKIIVVGWRGHGIVHRMFSGGSVSRAIVRSAPCAVLVVKGRPGEVRRLVLGVDGSAHARAAARFVAGLTPPGGGSVTLVAVVKPQQLPSLGLLPASGRAMIVRGARAEHDARVKAARRDLDRLAAIVQRGGWKVDAVVRAGAPVTELVAAAGDADVVVVGARGVGGLEGLLIGSVADGVLRHSPTSVLIVR